ncbi:uncharacterized protein METZ01_LOCUS421268 [marine metagenome]|uniref:Uncharacterized protein n=1 Tax=marine metagenome TaxID=408172 RepID=A0A382XC26_9ZZZZ
MKVVQTLTLTKSGANFATWEEAYSQFDNDYDGDLEGDMLSAGSGDNTLSTVYALTSSTTFTCVRMWKTVTHYLNYTDARRLDKGQIALDEMQGQGQAGGWEIIENVEPDGSEDDSD